MLSLQLHAALDGYALAFVDAHRRETVERFATFEAAARALRAAEAAAARISSLQTYNGQPRLRP